MEEKKRRSRGILFIIISAFCFAWMNVFVRLSGDLPSIQKSFFRNFVAFFVALFIIMKEKVPFKIEKQQWKYLIARSAFGTVGILGNFYAIDHLVVSDASILNKLSPFFAILFSFFLLKEKVKPIQVTCVSIAFVGALFIIKPGFQNVSIFPALMGAMGGMMAGLAYTFVRILGKDGVKGPIIVIFFSGFSCLVTLPYLLFDFTPMTIAQVLTLIGAGVAASGGQFFITAAYTYAPAGEISIYDYTQIIFVTVISFLLLHEVPDFYSVIGYVIICGASLFMFLYNRKRREVV